MPRPIVNACVRCLLPWALALTVAACVPTLRDAVPAGLADKAEPAGYSNVRVWGDAAEAPLRQMLAEELGHLKARYAAHARGHVPKANLLAISGGADDGAFGAGVLVGWSARGDRPQFDLVTGISAGALIAPFAFLGTDYDRQLEAVFTQIGSEDIYETRILAGMLSGTAITDNSGLARLIAKHVDARLVARIAEQRAHGRFLVIGTTNLDAQRPVFWDIGRIAQSGRPEAVDLIRDVLRASASLPGLFPPVNIRVQAAGKAYDEMHVDGGPTREVFFSPSNFSFKEIDRLVGRPVERKLWVIRNGKLTPEYAPVAASTLAITQRSLETLTMSQGIGDLLRMYQKAKADGIAFNLLSIPPDFAVARPQPFDRSYMKALFQRGAQIGREGRSWVTAPPDTGSPPAR